MKLKYFNDNLEFIDNIINDASSNITLKTNYHNVAIFGIVTFANGNTKTVQFCEAVAPVEDNDFTYRAQLIFDEEDIKQLQLGITFRLNLVSALFEKLSEPLTPSLNIPSIKLSLKKIHNNEIADMHKEIYQMKETLKALSEGYKLGIEIKGTQNIQPGMVPVAIDGGVFVGAYPFQDTVKDINGLRPIDNKILLTAKDIPYADSNLENYVKTLAGAVLSVSNLNTKLLEQLQELRNQVNDLDIRFENYKNKGLM